MHKDNGFRDKVKKQHFFTSRAVFNHCAIKGQVHWQSGRMSMKRRAGPWMKLQGYCLNPLLKQDIRLWEMYPLSA